MHLNKLAVPAEAFWRKADTSPSLRVGWRRAVHLAIRPSQWEYSVNHDSGLRSAL